MTKDTVTPLRKQVPCPQCKKQSTRDTYPFCSRRCAQLDLGAWLSGGYAISGDSTDVPPDGNS
ncbi:DNA gyrase inhibitor YacG [Ahrensia sp. R2A130]|uniref:DNA gyrase inhibitor YacG n=1 Tax=Ahrensia sp. R2A130 TaxID=744979 RepID=UPI0001E0A499|nr:DNA gyrase inhibitor YacG [Ahrensia sp. R2A130]EFL88632.1 conserved domain protein [Ahrensia sp. R2A130]